MNLLITILLYMSMRSMLSRDKLQMCCVTGCVSWERKRRGPRDTKGIFSADARWKWHVCIVSAEDHVMVVAAPTCTSSALTLLSHLLFRYCKHLTLVSINSSQCSNCSKTASGVECHTGGRIEPRVGYVELGGDPPRSHCGRRQCHSPSKC